MALVTMKNLLEQARALGPSAWAVWRWSREFSRRQRSWNPVILQIAEVRLKYSPLALMGPMMVQAAREA